jgi:hypothetical protein
MINISPCISGVNVPWQKGLLTKLLLLMAITLLCKFIVWITFVFRLFVSLLVKRSVCHSA